MEPTTTFTTFLSDIFYADNRLKKEIIGTSELDTPNRKATGTYFRVRQKTNKSLLLYRRLVIFSGFLFFFRVKVLILQDKSVISFTR